ncbi:MAG: exosortase [Proteobacteria bacterium]|nr:exosortase [Pseudomonadota bacterium]
MNNSNKQSHVISSNKLSLGFLLSIFIIAYFPVLKSLILFWNSSDDYSHGFFIIPISCYIVWQKKDALKKIPASSSFSGLVIVVVSLLIYVLATYAEISTVKSLSIVPFLGGSILYLFGFRMLKAVMFPILFLLFMIPVPGQIYSSLTIPLQLFVSKISVGISSMLGIPIYRDGNVIHLPDHTLQVVQACSGLRSLMSLLTLSAVFGYFTLKSNILRSILFATAIPTAICVNIVRVFMMTAAFYYFQYDLTEGTVHTAFGMIIFILALAIIVLIGKILSIWDNSATQE